MKIHSPRTQLIWLTTLMVITTLAACCQVRQSQPQSTPYNDEPIWENAAIDPVFVDLTRKIPGLMTDVRYATNQNFTRQILYDSATPYLVAPAADSLVAVQNELKRMGLQLVVFDGYRPLSVQKKMWAVYPDSRFVANPANGSRHNRGCAIDLTLADSLGHLLEMPTDYDDFTEKAGASFMDLPSVAIQNRALLKQVMERHGFIGLGSEWWHFDFQGWQNYPLSDIPVEPGD